MGPRPSLWVLGARPLQQLEVAAVDRPGAAAWALVPRGRRGLGARPLQELEVAAARAGRPGAAAR